MRCKEAHSLAERLCGERDMVVCAKGAFDLCLVSGGREDGSKMNPCEKTRAARAVTKQEHCQRLV